jgi:aspartyl-tRNA(Asn)/glutamyl-tRNA(Gln) amidotransferase subunit C
MTKEEVIHLAKLSRLELSPTEIENFTKEISAILEYVSVVQDIAGDDNSALPKVGAVHNVFRKDEVTNEADEYTKDLLAEMPQTSGRFMVVKKILNTDTE